MKIDAVVLAGRQNTGKLMEESEERYEANIDIAGRPMVSYILATLRAHPDIGDIYLVGERDGLGRYESPGIVLVEPTEDLFGNVKAGLGSTKTDLVLVAASDIPLVSVEALSDFVNRCVQSGADFCYPASSKADCDAAFPGVARTYVTLKDGVFTGGNLFMVRRAAVDAAWPLVEKMVKYRKSPVKMVSLLGVGLVFKFAMKTASVAELEDRVQKLLGLIPKAILGVNPEIGVDVDKPSDLELCRRVLGARIPQ